MTQRTHESSSEIGYHVEGLGTLGTMAPDRVLTFNRFRIDPARGQLYGDSGPISLTPKALSLLEYLARSPGPPGSKIGAARRGLAGRVRCRRGAEGLHP